MARDTTLAAGSAIARACVGHVAVTEPAVATASVDTSKPARLSAQNAPTSRTGSDRPRRFQTQRRFARYETGIPQENATRFASNLVPGDTNGVNDLFVAAVGRPAITGLSPIRGAPGRHLTVLLEGAFLLSRCDGEVRARHHGRLRGSGRERHPHRPDHDRSRCGAGAASGDRDDRRSTRTSSSSRRRRGTSTPATT